MDAASVLQDQDLAEVLRTVSDRDKSILAAYFMNSQVRKSNDVYYSRFRIQGNVTQSGSAPAVTSTIAVPAGTKVKPFQYGKSDAMVAAGFANRIASLADTNVQTKGQTNNQEVFVIQGVGVQLAPDTDPEIARQFLGELEFSCGFGGDEETWKFGPLTFWPGAGGLYGGGASVVASPDLASAAAQYAPLLTNGMPAALNYRPLPEAIVWYPQNANTSDTNITFVVTNPNAISVVSGVGRAAAAGIAAFQPPLQGGRGSYLDGWIQLFGTQIGPRSKNR